MNEPKPPAEMTRRELAREVNEANYREPGPWSDEEWRRFLAVVSEFISRVSQDDIEVEIHRAKHITLWLIGGAVVALIIFGLLIFGHVGVTIR